MTTEEPNIEVNTEVEIAPVENEELSLGERDLEDYYSGGAVELQNLERQDFESHPMVIASRNRIAEEEEAGRRTSIFRLAGASARGLTQGINANTKNLVADAGAFVVKKSNELGVGIAALFEDDPDVLKFLAQEYQDEQSQVDAMRDLIKQKTDLPVFGKSETASEIFVEKLFQFAVPFWLVSKSKTVAGLSTEIGEAAAKKFGKIVGGTTDVIFRGNIASGISSVAAFEAGEQGFAELLLEMSNGDQGFVDEGLEWFSGRGDDAFVDRFKLGLEDFILGGVLGFVGKTAGAIGRAGKEFLAGKQTVDAVVGLAENIRNGRLTEQLKTMEPMVSDAKIHVHNSEKLQDLKTAIEFENGKKVTVSFTPTRVAEDLAEQEDIIRQLTDKIIEKHAGVSDDLLKQAEESIAETAKFNIAEIMAENIELGSKEMNEFLEKTGSMKLEAMAEQLAAGANLDAVGRQLAYSVADETVPTEEVMRLLHETLPTAKTLRDAKAMVPGAELRAVKEAIETRAKETQVILDNFEDIVTLHPDEQRKALLEMLQAGATAPEIAGSVRGAVLNWIKGGKGPAKLGEAIVEYWMNGILSGLAIPTAGIVTEAMNVLKMLDDANAVGVGALRKAGRKLTGSQLKAADKSRPSRSLSSVYIAHKRFYTMHVTGFLQAMKRLGNVKKIHGDFQAAKNLPGMSEGQAKDFFSQSKFKSGKQKISADYQGVDRENSPGLARSIDFIGNGSNIPTNTIGGMDNLLKVPLYTSEMEGRAMAIMFNTEPGVFPFAKKHKDKAKQLVELMTNPPKGVKPVEALRDMGFSSTDIKKFNAVQKKIGKGARDWGLEATMQSPIKEGSWPHSAVQFLKKTPMVGPVMFPFMNTATNLFSDIIQHIPGGANFSQRTQAAYRAGGYELDRALSKQATGAMLMYFAMSMYDLGLYTGPEPTNAAERKTRLTAGERFNSFLVNGKYYDIGRFDPITSLFNMGWLIADKLAQVDAYDHLTDDEINELQVIMFALAEGVGHMAQNKTYLDGVDQLLKLTQFKGGDAQDFSVKNRSIEGATRAMKRFGASLVPFSSAMGLLAGELDPFVRDADTFEEHLLNKIPYLSKGVKPKLDIFGKPVKRLPSRTFGVLPIPQGIEGNDPIAVEMRRVGAFIDTPKRRQSFGDNSNIFDDKKYAIDLTGEEHYRLEELQNEVFLSTGYKDMQITGNGLHEILSNLIKNRSYNLMETSDKAAAIKAVTNIVRNKAKDMLLEDPVFGEELKSKVAEQGRITRHIANAPNKHREAIIENATTPTFNPAVQE